jgi:hypothetical protein
MTRIVIILILVIFCIAFLTQLRRRPKSTSKTFEPKANEALPTSTGIFRARQLLGHDKHTSTSKTGINDSFDRVESDPSSSDIFEKKEFSDPFSEN